MKAAVVRICMNLNLTPSSTFYCFSLLWTGFNVEDKLLLTALLLSCMMTISQDIFNICIMCVVYEVRRKGIIYYKTYFFSLFTPCLEIKSQSNKSVFFFFFFFLPKCPIVFKHSRLLCFLCNVMFCYFELDSLLWVGTWRPSRSATFYQF